MNQTLTFPQGPRDSPGPSRQRSDGDGPRCAAYVIIAVAALVTGFVLGMLSAQGPSGAPPSPDALLPHPRSLQR